MEGPTEKQMQALRGLAEGMTVREIAEQAGVSSSSVRQHLVALKWKLGVGLARHIVPAARKAGWL